MINIFAIIVSTIIYFILGALWYSNYLFGKAWVKANKFDMNELSMGPKELIGAAGSAFVSVLFFAILLELIAPFDFVTALLVSFIIGSGFIFTTGLYDVLYEDKNVVAYLIDASYHFVAILIAGLILGLWQI
jgi:hypothetical protein